MAGVQAVVCIKFQDRL